MRLHLMVSFIRLQEDRRAIIAKLLIRSTIIAFVYFSSLKMEDDRLKVSAFMRSGNLSWHNEMSHCLFNQLVSSKFKLGFECKQNVLKRDI